MTAARARRSRHARRWAIYACWGVLAVAVAVGTWVGVRGALAAQHLLEAKSLASTVPADGATALPWYITGGGSSGTTTNPGSSLPRTGADSTMLLTLWVAGGALALAGASIVVGTAVRRQRATVAK
ncbi:hypothetical protein CJ026_025760 [Ralstonia pickettii]|uniref:LPXTG cell wall anchor domain-containing protein n=1 Tax=Ralstonia pickettii TaxID=329 RepID=UPI000CD5392D|nr:hypothetical protein CJ026_025760 [Ralstonia pickettii]